MLFPEETLQIGDFGLTGGPSAPGHFHRDPNIGGDNGLRL
jgi:hypothetical protein